MCAYATLFDLQYSYWYLGFIVASLRNLSKYDSITLNSQGRAGMFAFSVPAVLFICLWFEEFFAFSKTFNTIGSKYHAQARTFVLTSDAMNIPFEL